MLEIDRWALARAAEFQADMLAHYERCTSSTRGRQAAAVLLGRPGRLLPRRAEGPPVHHRRPKAWRGAAPRPRAYQITHAMLRWMAPVLSFTAEEAWKVFNQSNSIFLEPPAPCPRATALLAKWQRLRAIRDAVNKEIENVRSAPWASRCRHAVDAHRRARRTMRCWPAWATI